jgi:hypothetical protein
MTLYSPDVVVPQVLKLDMPRPVMIQRQRLLPAAR